MIKLDRAIELILEKIERQNSRIIKEFSDEPGLQILNGRWGPYISYKNKNYRIPKKTNPSELTKEECMVIINAAPEAKKTKKTRK